MSHRLTKNKLLSLLAMAAAFAGPSLPRNRKPRRHDLIKPESAAVKQAAASVRNATKAEKRAAQARAAERGKQGGYVDLGLYGMGAVIMFIIATMVLAVLAVRADWKNSEAEKARWAAFLTEHKCEIRAKTQASTTSVPITGFDTKGNATFSTASVHTPGTTTYVCDDNVTYVRND